MSQQNNSGPKMSMDLDALEREGGSEPFTFKLEGRAYTMLDPQSLDFKVLTKAAEQEATAGLGAVTQMLTLVLPDSDRDAFFAANLPAWKLEALMKGYLKHYGMPAPGESAGSRS